MRGLSQWGSVDLARDGMNPYEILQYYYGGDISIVFNAPVGERALLSRAASAPGDVGNDVLLLQRQLSRIRRNYPAIPEIPEPSTVFDVPMEEAVKSFQQIFNLTPDGIVGKATWYKIKQIYNGVKACRSCPARADHLRGAEAVYRGPAAGDSGLAVRTVRFFLAFLGYFLPELPPIRLSDVFDQEMLDAVYAFQSYAGLTTDGVVGRDTWNALRRAYEDVLEDLPEDYQQFAREIYPGRFIVLGDRGDTVLFLQQQLNRIAAQDPDIPAVAEDGIFGRGTQAAVLALQRKLGIDPTGAVGPVLWAKIVTQGAGY